MDAVIFEAWPKADQKTEYLDIAACLRPELKKVDSFISIERFSSLTEEGKMPSLSFWRDERAIKNWREHLEHPKVQSKGRSEIFENYRLRVAQVVRDYAMNDREQAPE